MDEKAHGELGISFFSLAINFSFRGNGRLMLVTNLIVFIE